MSRLMDDVVSELIAQQLHHPSTYTCPCATRILPDVALFIGDATAATVFILSILFMSIT